MDSLEEAVYNSFQKWDGCIWVWESKVMDNTCLSPISISLLHIEQSIMIVNWNITYQCEIYEENFSKYVDISRVMYWWNHRAELIETILHSLLFDSGKLTAKIWTDLSINIFSVLFFGLHHADTVIKKKVCHHWILNVSSKFHLEGERLFHESLQRISLLVEIGFVLFLWTHYIFV